MGGEEKEKERRAKACTLDLLNPQSWIRMVIDRIRVSIVGLKVALRAAVVVGLREEEEQAAER
ncbi:unnamed protein product [Dovyalis caffra]|uniref:Uncharacterized protein n=1 Tax=Dovyalis caffra TaxID=77055 RepID=A0AAV1SAX9_9ROSI|nr:unnamed protein product [Dovyalis caffra]